MSSSGVRVVDLEADDVAEFELVVHDAHAEDPTTAFAMSRLTDSGVITQAPIGIFRQVEQPTYDDLARAHVDRRRHVRGGRPGRRKRRWLTRLKRRSAAAV